MRKTYDLAIFSRVIDFSRKPPLATAQPKWKELFSIYDLYNDGFLQPTTRGRPRRFNHTSAAPLCVQKCSTWAHSSTWLVFPLPCPADLSSKDLFRSSHIWLLCVTLVMTLLEGQRWPLSLSPQRRMQTHRLWTVSSASNHQRFTHPEGIRGPLRDPGGTGRH